MAQFADAVGSTWKIPPIDVVMLDDLLAAGLDVEAVAQDLTKLQELLSSRRVFAQVLWVFVGEKVLEANLAPQDFKRRLTGDVVYSAALAIQERIIDFFPDPPAVKKRLVASLREGQRKAIEAVAAKIDNLAGSANSSGNSPASAAAIPRDGPSDN